MSFGFRKFIREHLPKKRNAFDNFEANYKRDHDNGNTVKRKSASYLPSQSELVEQRAMFSADSTIRDCKSFIQKIYDAQSKSAVEKVAISAMKKISNVSKLHVKSSVKHQKLLNRLEKAENDMKIVLDVALVHEVELTTKCEILFKQVKDCITFNNEMIPKLKTMMELLMNLLYDINLWLQSIQNMSKFNSEIARQKELQFRYIPKCLQHDHTNHRIQSEPSEDIILTLSAKFSHLRKVLKY
jgi:hypothetical protein